MVGKPETPLSPELPLVDQALIGTEYSSSDPRRNHSSIDLTKTAQAKGKMGHR